MLFVHSFCLALVEELDHISLYALVGNWLKSFLIRCIIPLLSIIPENNLWRCNFISVMTSNLRDPFYLMLHIITMLCDIYPRNTIREKACAHIHQSFICRLQKLSGTSSYRGESGDLISDINISLQIHQPGDDYNDGQDDKNLCTHFTLATKPFKIAQCG